MSAIFCSKCGYQLSEEAAFCRRCGTRVDATERGVSPLPSQSVVYVQPQKSRSGVAKVVVIAFLIILILIVPIIPRDRVVYINGVTQAVSMSTSYNTSIQTYTTTAPMQIGVYQGTLQYIPDQYYNQYGYQNYYNQYSNQNYYSQYYYGNYQYPYSYYYYPYTNTSSPSCHYSYYDDYYCAYSYYYYPYYGYYNNPYSYYYNYPYGYNYNNYSPYSGNNYATTVTINPSDNVVRVQQAQESNGLTTLTLTHFDGTSTTYKHVTQQSLVQSGTSMIPATSIITNTVTNSAVAPVTSAVQCQNCVLQHVTEYVSLLQLLLGH